MRSSTGCSRLPGNRTEKGQAAVEVALTLPLLVVLAAVLIDVAVVASQQVAVVEAARAAARAAAVGPDADATATARAAAPGLAADRLEVAVRREPAVATAEVRFRTKPASVLLGRFIPSLELTATEKFPRESDIP